MNIINSFFKYLQILLGIAIPVINGCTNTSDVETWNYRPSVYDSIRIENLEKLTAEYANIVGPLPLKVIFLNSSKSELRIVIASSIVKDEISRYKYDAIYVNDNDTFLVINNMSTLFYNDNQFINEYLNKSIEKLSGENIHYYKSIHKYGYGTWAVLFGNGIDSLDKLYPDPFSPIYGGDSYYQFPFKPLIR